MNVFLVIETNIYYEGKDNILGVFDNKEKSEAFVKNRVTLEPGWEKYKESWIRLEYEMRLTVEQHKVN